MHHLLWAYYSMYSSESSFSHISLALAPLYFRVWHLVSTVTSQLSEQYSSLGWGNQENTVKINILSTMPRSIAPQRNSTPQDNDGGLVPERSFTIVWFHQVTIGCLVIRKFTAGSSADRQRLCRSLATI